MSEGMIKMGEDIRAFLQHCYRKLIKESQECGDTINTEMQILEAALVFAVDPNMLNQGKSILKDLKALETKMNHIIDSANKMKIKTTKNLSSDLKEWKERIQYFITFFSRATKD